MTKTILETNGLYKTFSGLTAVRNLDIEVEEGEIHGLIGPNGSGKTTFLNVVTGYLSASAGTVTFKGEPFSRTLSAFEIAKRGLVRTFQITSIFADLTVEDNVIAARHLKSRSTLWGSLFYSIGYRRDNAQLKRKASEILALTGLDARRDATAATLSAGEQRHLEMAIALAAEPAVLLLDEPAAGLNPDEQSRLMTLIRELHRNGLTILLVEHAMKVVIGLCDRITVLNFGEKIAEGTPQEIAHNEEVIKAYLGTRRNT